ncbi:TPA: hypothetical protein ENG04_06600 [Candidatus Poribacteria bacterium]|nr:hypothetical protein [Candidatus Poribacteria bacterium]HEX29734.1 hypothetical protein [Candidatus Poribacteria bacterium]
MKFRVIVILAFVLLISRVSSAEVNGYIEKISPADGGQAVSVIYLWGTPYQMGYAHGKLCSAEIKDLYGKFVSSMSAAAGVPPEKLDEVWDMMSPYISDRIKEEMRGLAEGSGVDLKTIQRVHSIPALSEYHCTFFAAWRKATTNGHLHQIRALDYAIEAHIQDHPAIIIYRPEGKNSFLSVGWVGFIGVVTGINEKRIALSEIGDNYGNEKETLRGEPFIFLARRLLEEADSLKEGIQIIRNAHRTSSYLYCIGDGKIPAAVALMTCRNFCYVFDPHSLPNRQLEDVVYFSMGADSKWNEKIYEILKPKWGKINRNVGIYDVMRGAGTGNLHAVHFDVTDLMMWFANAGVDASPAYNHAFVEFDVANAFEKLRRLSMKGE